MKFEDLDLFTIGTDRQMAGVVFTGLGETLLCLFPQEDLEGAVVELPMSMGDWERFLQQTDRLEVEAVELSDKGQLVKTILRKSARQISQKISWAVYKRDHFRCRYCGSQGGDSGTTLTVDHLVLWEKMGPSIEANLVTACRRCNKVRGNTEYDDWLKSSYYQGVSRHLPPAILEANKAVASTLARIPRRKVAGKRR